MKKIREKIAMLFLALLLIISSFNYNADLFANEGSLEETEQVSLQELDSIEPENGENLVPKEEDSKKVKVDSISGITVTIPNSSNLKFQTYIDPVTGLGPDKMNLPLALSVDKAGMTGLYLEIPYSGYMPSLNDEVFENFIMDEDIFQFVNTGTPEGNSIVESIEDDVVNKLIKIKLKETTQTVETINLTFMFNQNYYSKLAPNQIIWKDIQATIKSESDEVVFQTEKYNVTSEARDGMAVDTSLRSPSTPFVSTDMATFNAIHRNNYNAASILDETYENNIMYFDIPKILEVKLTPGGAFNNYETIDLGDVIRYQAKFKDAKEYYNFWNYGGNPNTNYNSTPITLSGFDLFNIGETVDIVVGQIYKKINGPVNENTHTLTYTKTKADDFKINLSLIVFSN